MTTALGHLQGTAAFLALDKGEQLGVLLMAVYLRNVELLDKNNADVSGNFASLTLRGCFRFRGRSGQNSMWRRVASSVAKVCSIPAAPRPLQPHCQKVFFT